MRATKAFAAVAGEIAIISLEHLEPPIKAREVARSRRSRLEKGARAIRAADPTRRRGAGGGSLLAITLIIVTGREPKLGIATGKGWGESHCPSGGTG